MAPVSPEDVEMREDLQNTDFAEADEADDFRGFKEDAPVEDGKDDTEEELERLVFGDSAGFRERIKKQQLATTLRPRGDKEEAQEGETGLEEAQDADLFFYDAGASSLPVKRTDTVESSDEDEGRGDPPAWEDSDDDRITISLASVPRLRKLRKTEAEDLITGRQYIKRLRQQFQRLYPTPEWALQDPQRPTKRRRTSVGPVSDGDESEDEDPADLLSIQPLAKLLKTADSLTSHNHRSSNNKKRKLKPEVIDIQRTRDIQSSGPSSTTSLQIHPTLPLLLSCGGAAGLVSLHHITSAEPTNPNPILTTVHLKGASLDTVSFAPDESDPRIFMAGNRRYFHVWNLTSGAVEKVTRLYGHQKEQRAFNDFKVSPDGAYVAVQGTERKGGGVVNMLDAKTLQWVAQARVEAHGGIAGFCWWGNGGGLSIAGKSGEIAEWDLVRGVVVARWRDEGAVGTTVLSMGGKGGPGTVGGDRWVAIGSSSGIVNVYDRRGWEDDASAEEQENNEGVPRMPRPKKCLDQLTTPVSHLKFSPDGQLLCMASRWKRDSLRLVHLPSCTVYRNWPTSQTPLGRISAVALGEANGETVLIVGNEAGTIRGWEVRQ